MATETRNNRDLVKAIQQVTRELDRMNRILATVNENLVQLGRNLKENQTDATG